MMENKIRHKIYSFIVSIVVVLTLSAFFNQVEVEIEWNDKKKLTWEDFKGAIPLNPENKGAETASGIKISMFKWNDNIGNVKVFASFNTSKSWTRIKGNEPALKHEQGHFDITEIYARKLRKKLNCKKFKRSTSSKELQCIIDEIETEKNNYQTLYDEQTKHHLNNELQEKWNIKIANEIKALEKYRNVEVKIFLK